MTFRINYNFINLTFYCRHMIGCNIIIIDYVLHVAEKTQKQVSRQALNP